MTEPLPIIFQGNRLFETTLKSDCSCEDYDAEFDAWYSAEDCTGCYEDGKFEVEAMLLEWKDRVGFMGEYVRVNGSHVSWQSISITRVVHISDLVESLEIRGDFSLYFRLDNDELSIIRTSHDEPTGAYFLVKPEYQEEVE
jgi:hypothetical protein